MHFDKIKILIYTILIFPIILIIINSDIVANLYWQLSSRFVDYMAMVNWLECHSLGVDLYVINESYSVICDGKKAYPISYGHALLFLPYNDVLAVFYTKYLPFIIIFLFIFLTIKIINPKNKIEKLLLFLIIFNPSVLLAFDRLNFDMIVYILAIIICFNRIYVINWFSILFVSLIKVYPVALFINIFFESQKRTNKNIFLVILLISFVTLAYAYFYTETILFFLEALRAGKPGYHYLFSLNSIPKILEYIFNLNYQIMLLLTYSLFIFLVVKINKNFNSLSNQLQNDIFSNNSKLFMVGGYTSVICFFLFSNWFYREVFLILMIPHLLSLKSSTDNKVLKLLFFLIIARYIYLFPYSYVNIHDGITHINDVRIFSTKFLIVIFLKSVFDFIIMTLFSALLVQKTTIYLKSRYSKI
ncbi:hypothetical protein ABXT63_01975 [Candidatus Pelagibacter sp. Uisw_092]|uniref:hypothetical protein n=1 Tax=Candidatus Pelagibacter sp. Uisw_092 TaxID=3230979 RepID=UPI0039EB417E